MTASTETVDPVKIANELNEQRMQSVRDLKAARDAEAKAAAAVEKAQEALAEAGRKVETALDVVASAGWSTTELRTMGLAGRGRRRSQVAAERSVAPNGTTDRPGQEREKS